MRKDFAIQKFGLNKQLMPNTDYEVYGYLSHGDVVKENTFTDYSCMYGRPNPNNMVGTGVNQYGQIIVTLKKDRMKHRTTMVIGNSLDERDYTAPTSIEGKKDLASMGLSSIKNIANIYEYLKKKADGEDVKEYLSLDKLLLNCGVNYFELQYHGGVTLDDIESISLLEDYHIEKSGVVPDKEIPEELRNLCKKKGIKTYVVKDGQKNEV